MEFHGAANIFPLDEEHIDELAEDIRRHGQQVPIEILDGKIIDGRRRYTACAKAGVEPKCRAIQTDDPIAYVLSLNLHRRHLSPTQLAMVGARAREWYDEQAKERQKSSGHVHGRGKEKVVENFPQPISGSTGKARDEVGKAVGVSGKSIDYATKVLNQGTEKLIAAVDADKISVSTAAKMASLSEEEQNGIASRQTESSRRRPRPMESEPVDEENQPETNREVKGKGITLANEAINSLSRIPKNDALRKRGFQLVTDWIRRNK